MDDRRGFMSGIVGGILGFLLGTPTKYKGLRGEEWVVNIKKDLVPEGETYQFTNPLPAVVCEGKEQMLFVERMVEIPAVNDAAFSFQRKWQRIAWEDLKEGMVVMSVYTDGKELGEVERFVVGPGGYMGLNDRGIKYISVKEGSTHDFLAEAHTIGLEEDYGPNRNTTGDGLTPVQMIETRDKIVTNLLGVDVDDRDVVLDELRERDYTLWTLVRNRLKELRDVTA